MRRLNPDKLSVEYRNGATKTQPVIGRKYTLTHSDITGELFITIGLKYAYEKISTMRDEVLAEWRMYNGYPFLYVYVHVDPQSGFSTTALRNAIFRRELPLALETIRYGDNSFFKVHPELDDAPIWIYFYSKNLQFNRFEYWGNLKNYR